MNWANLSILGVGGLLLTVPIILHFLMQPKPKDIVFPAMRFLKQRQQRNRSRMRIRHFLLLLMRCLLIGLVALALAGPSVASGDFGNWLTVGGIGFSGLLVGLVMLLSFFREKKNWILIGILGALFLGHLIYGGISANRLLNSESAQLLGDEQAPIAALIVVDTSPRMDYKNDNKTRWEVANEMAQWLIGQFPADSQVCVLPTNNERPFFSVDVAAAKRRMETLETDFSGNTVPAALLDGLKILNKAQQERKEIYVVTDLTKQSWVGENPKALLKQLQNDPSTNLFLLDVGVESASNFSLTQLKLSDAEITQGGRLTISTEIARRGSAAPRTIKMSIEKPEPPRPVVRDERTLFPESTLDGQEITKELQANDSAPLKFTFSKSLPVGTYHGKIEIEGQDGLAIDDRRYFSIRVGESQRALIVHPENVNPAVLEVLLGPGDAESGSSKFETETIKQDELTNQESVNQTLAQYDAIFLLNPTPLKDENWQELEVFVQNGGGLGVFLGHNAADGPLADPGFQSEAAKRVLSGSLEQQWYNEDPDLFLSPKDLTHPMFKFVRLNETDVLWNQFPVFIHWGIEPDENYEELPTQTVLRFGNREPAVIERTIGTGRVLVMTTPITEYGYVAGRTGWNRLLSGNPVPAYILLKGMTSFLAQHDTQSLNVEVGQSVSFNNDPQEYPETYQVFSPDPEKPPSNLNTDKKLRYRFTNSPGHYRLKGIFNESVLLRGFSVNIDEAATNLDRIMPDELDSFLGADRYQLAKQKNEIQRKQGETRRGQEFFPLLMLMVLVVLAVEYLMSNRFYKG